MVEGIEESRKMNSLDEAAKTVVNTCMALKQGENVLIITDENKAKIAQTIKKSAEATTDRVDILEIPVGRINGEEPSSEVAERMKYYDVVIIPTTKSISHTKARIEATKSGVRLASMPGITEEMMVRTMNADYSKVKELTNKLGSILNKGENVRVTTKKGTDISMSIKGKKCHGQAGGIFSEKGSWGNLPEGEACLGPVEGTTNGVFFVDASMGTGKLKKGLKITVKDGFAVGFEGEEAKELLEMFEGLGNDAFNIAELGIGTNDKAIITGNVLEDEKVLGTAHIALGNNMSYGGTVNVPIHIDGIFTAPSIWVDDEKIMEEGKLLI